MKATYYSLLIISYFLLVDSCSSPRFPDYTETKNGLFYRLEDVGEGERRAKQGDYVTAQILIKSDKDSILFDTQKIGMEGAITFILPAIEYAKDYREGYLYLNEGDRAVFLTDAYTFFIKKNHAMIPKGMTLESIISVETMVLKISSQEEHAKEIAKENAKLEQGEFEEKKTLEKYISDSGIKELPFSNGIYCIKLQEGKGLTPDSGRVALLNYRGFFLNGRCFDSSFESQPFEYIIGAEEQLIPGLAIGVRRMREGEKTKFIIPSHLAFGSNGSSTGIIPPFTTVIYEVELLKVQ